MIGYTLSIDKTETHLAEVSVEVQSLRGETADFIFPAWSPGSYAIRDYAKNVVKAEAFDAGGKPLPCVKTEKHTWRVTLPENGNCRFSYQVYCHETGVQQSYIDDSHAILHGPSLFVYLDGHKNQACRLALRFPEKWKKVSTGLDPVQGSGNTFEARDYDTFIDCPVEIGNHAVHAFHIQNIPHYFALYGQGNVDPEKLVSDAKKIVEAAIPVFNHIPYNHYTFILHLQPERGGGLEHLNSTLMQVSRWSFKPEEEYRKVLSLISHEVFHLWNVKRLAPKPLLHFDYTVENYTNLLWVAEGITSYYEDLILLRAGLYTAEDYFKAVLDDYKAYQESPGHQYQSACESSFDTWIKFYRLTESFRNLSVSYYRHGALLGLCLDLLIRKETRGQSTLDHVLRGLYEETYLKTWTGYTLQDFEEACLRHGGEPVKRFFERHVEGREEIDLNDFLPLAGLRLSEKKEKEGESGGYLGVEWRKSEGRILVSVVLWGTPAASAGLSPGDEIIGWDGIRAHTESFSHRVQEARPGSRHRVQIFRQDVLKELEIEIGEKPKQWKIEPVENPDAECLDLRKGWLGAAELKKDEHGEKQPVKQGRE